MEFNNIIALVPEGEHFDAAAINEGIFLSEGHVIAIENALAGSAQEVATAQDLVNAAQLQVDQANESLQAAQQALADRDATIQQLNEQITALKAAPAGQIQQPVKDGDEIEAAKKVFESEITKEAARLRALRSKK